MKLKKQKEKFSSKPICFEDFSANFQSYAKKNFQIRYRFYKCFILFISLSQEKNNRYLKNNGKVPVTSLFNRRKTDGNSNLENLLRIF